ncbi:MAG: ribulose-phosphate 3-epimerase [Defluviitaleaceae bacterium]|nr:ribulose-phosphate 3-epimerase [Defluviitaleaceae bacterium]
MNHSTEIKLFPSILCADHGILAQEITDLTAAGVDAIHVDVMDGTFVPNFACGAEIMRTLKQHTHLPLDVHLMITNPAAYIDYFRALGADTISIHAEADPHAARTLAKIREVGAIPGLAINPGTSIESIKELLPLCGHVLAMTVNPGFAGQSFLPFTLEKLRVLGTMAAQHGFTLCVDGAMDPDKIVELHAMGVNAFVLGTKSLFYPQPNRPAYAEIIKKLRCLV